MEFYLHFNLTMDRSPGFGPYACNYFAQLRLGLPTAPDLKSLTFCYIHTLAGPFYKKYPITL